MSKERGVGKRGICPTRGRRKAFRRRKREQPPGIYLKEMARHKKSTKGGRLKPSGGDSDLVKKEKTELTPEENSVERATRGKGKRGALR